MANDDRYEDEELQDGELADDELEGEGEDDGGMDERTGAIAGWGISIAVHAIALLLIGMVVMAAKMNEDRPPIKVVALDAPPPPPPDKNEKRDLVERPNSRIDADMPEVPNPVISNLDLPVEETSTEDPVETDTNKPKGREEAVSTSEMAGNGAFMAIGAGGGAAGAFGYRNGGGRRRAIGRFGGSRGSESAVEAALKWFAIHQSENGMWDVDQYQTNCKEGGALCEPGKNQTGGDPACSGYALLCYLGAGYDHKHMSKWRNTVKKGIDWLVANQQADGSWGRNYENGICTMAVAEAYALSGDGALKEPAQKAVDYLLSVQAKGNQPGGDAAYDGLGWDYTKANPGRMDGSVSGWCVMGLKSAKAAGLDVKNGLEGAKKYLEGAWKACNPGWEKIDVYGRSKFPYTWAVDGKCGPPRLACVGALCAVFLGYKLGEPMLESLANEIMAEQMPTAYPCNTYYMYYNTLAIFQVGGERWDKWNATVRDVLINAQSRGQQGECFNGSWDYQGTVFHGHEIGRLLSTAYCCLSLEVYYRYLPVAAGRGDGAPKGKLP